MTCITPDLTPGLNLSLYESRTEVELRQKRNTDSPPINDADLNFYLSFILDGVTGYGNYTPIPVYKNPIFHRFHEDQYIRLYSKDDHEIQILVSCFNFYI